MGYDDEWQPYVPVGQKKAKARNFADKLAKKQKRERQPIEIEGRKIARSFWGNAWCDHLESLSDYSNRLPRGGTYVRNGSVVDLVVKPGIVHAVVAGSEPYEVSISIKKLDKTTWANIKKDCSSSIDSLIDLLGGRLSDAVMHRLTDKKSGCFPSARQIEMDCDCPDWSSCCKHIAAVMYAIGSRLDSEPELLFLLRGVKQEELISQAVSKENLAHELAAGPSDLGDEDLGAIFGIELDSTPETKVAEVKVAETKVVTKRSKVKTASRTTSRRRKVAAIKKSVGKKTAKSPANKKAVRKKTVSAATPTKKKPGVKKKKKKKVAVKKATLKKVAKKRTVTKKKAVKTSAAAKKSRKAKKVSARKKTSARKSTSGKPGSGDTSAKSSARKSSIRKAA